jgi:4-amino-4-deoxy-L-arabinose transferase-like glycosyltransferase
MLSISEQLSFIGGLAHGYSIFNGLHLIIFEKGVHLPLITNCFLGGATTILVYRLGQKFVDQKVGRTGAYLVAFSPTLIFWSSVNLKEIILSFLICVAIYSFLCLKDTMSIKHIAVLLVCLVIILIVRIYIAVILGIAFSLSLLFGKYGLRKQIRGAIILLVSFGFIWFMVEQVPTIQSTFVEIMNLARGEILTESASDFSRTAERGHFMGQFSQAAPLTWLINAFHFLFSPSPYRLRWMLAGMLNIGTWIWIVLFPYFVFGVIYYRRQRLQALTPILLFMLGLVLAIAPFATRSGNRHKAQLLPLFFLMVSSGFIEYRSRPNGYLRLMIWIGIWVGITTFEFLL